MRIPESDFCLQKKDSYTGSHLISPFLLVHEPDPDIISDGNYSSESIPVGVYRGTNVAIRKVRVLDALALSILTISLPLLLSARGRSMLTYCMPFTSVRFRHQRPLSYGYCSLMD